MTPQLLLDRLWTEGGGIDDHEPIVVALRVASGGTRDDLASWSEWIASEDGFADDGRTLGRIDTNPAAERGFALLRLASELRAAITRCDHAQIDAALVAIDRALALVPRDRTGAVARGAADLALSEAAFYGRDLPAARRCLDALAASGPIAMRIAAVMRTTTLAVSNGDLRVAHDRASRAIALARDAGRPLQATHAQLLLALVAVLADDDATARSMIAPLVEANPANPWARLLTAVLDGPERAREILEGLATPIGRHHAIAYAVCAAVGSRRHEGNRVLVSARSHLAAHNQQLLAILDARIG